LPNWFIFESLCFWHFVRTSLPSPDWFCLRDEKVRWFEEPVGKLDLWYDAKGLSLWESIMIWS
jgi:hypothetical protein